MSHIAIRVLRTGPDEDPAIALLSKEIHQRAYSLYQQRGADAGHELDDWLRAESDVVCHPPFCIQDRGEEFRVSADVSEFEPAEVRADVLPRMIIVHAEHEAAPTTSGAGPHPKRLFTQVRFPVSIDPCEVHANMDHGRLEIVAKKAG